MGVSIVSKKGVQLGNSFVLGNTGVYLAKPVSVLSL
jgi:hypothetical protein